MITYKEDISGTFVKTENKELLLAYLRVAEDNGFDVYAVNLDRISPIDDVYAYCNPSIKHVQLNCDESTERNYKELTLSDLKPKPTKFVKVEESIFDLKKEFENGELYSSDCEGHYTQLKCENKLYLAAHQDSVYRQVEIDWRDEVKKLDKSALFHDSGDLFLIIDSNSNDFISMCHEVASLTEKPEGV